MALVTPAATTAAPVSMLNNVRQFIDQTTSLPTGMGISATLGNGGLFAVFPDCKNQDEADDLLDSGNFIKEVAVGKNGSPFVRITKLPTAEEVTEIKTILSAGRSRKEVLAAMDLGVEF